jgi:peroxiredoxin
MFRILLVLLSSLLFVVQLSAAELPSPLGRQAESFRLQDFRGKMHALEDFSDSKLLVIAFMGTECPLAKLYAPRMEALSQKFDTADVQFLIINSNRQDSLTELAAYARIHKLSFPVLKDPGNRVADQLGAIRTPEAFVLDENRSVRYWGRIDDQYGIGYARDEPERNDVEIAVNQLLAGKEVEVAYTKSVGCYIGRVRKVDADSPVTYSNQVARILQKRCVECEEVAGWADMIVEVIQENRMPPWHADPKHGAFRNDRRMSDDEKHLMEQWASAGAPKGDPKDLPEPLTFTKGWQLPQKPDMVIPMRDEPYVVPAEGAVKYQYFTVDPGFTEDKWMKAAELLPGNHAVVHHILIFIREPGAKRRRGLEEGFLSAYVPGFRPSPLPDGMAKHIPAGSKFVFQVHYTPNGSQQEDLSKLGLIFADPKEITHVVQTVEAIDTGFEIPPNAGNHKVEADAAAYDRQLMLLSMSPHMHLRGKSFSYEARYPDGSRETLLDVPAYDFNWQTTYQMQEMKPLPGGTVVHCVAHYDNSEENLNNPDPEETVKWGDQTWQEMMIGFYDVAYPVDQEAIQSGKSLKLKPTSESVAKRILKRFDKDGDGKVVFSEVPRRGKLFFLRFDKNGDGELTVKEVAAIIEETR